MTIKTQNRVKKLLKGIRRSLKKDIRKEDLLVVVVAVRMILMRNEKRKRKSIKNILQIVNKTIGKRKNQKSIQRKRKRRLKNL